MADLDELLDQVSGRHDDKANGTGDDETGTDAAVAAEPNTRIELFVTTQSHSSKVKSDVQRFHGLLNTKGVKDFDVHDVSSDEQAKERMWAQSNKKRDLPQLHIHGTFIGTYDQCLAMEEEGRFELNFTPEQLNDPERGARQCVQCGEKQMRDAYTDVQWKLSEGAKCKTCQPKKEQDADRKQYKASNPSVFDKCALM